MITVSPTTDIDYIKSVFLSPAIFFAMRDDSCAESPVGYKFPALEEMGGYFLRVAKDGADAGVFWFRSVANSLEAHTALLPGCRGRDAITAAKLAVQWIFDNTGIQRITSYAWSDSPVAAWLCRMAGLEEFDEQPWLSTRNGRPVNITYFQIQRA
jgi:hypothetical protein